MIPTKVVDQIAKNQLKHQAITLKKEKDMPKGSSSELLYLPIEEKSCWKINQPTTEEA